jgi:hypothetical protein
MPELGKSGDSVDLARAVRKSDPFRVTLAR